MSNTEFKTKVSKWLPKLLLSGANKDFSVTFFQKKRVLKKFEIKHTTKNNILKLSPSYLEATHKCYVSHVVVYVNKREAVKFTFNELFRMDVGESITMDRLRFLLNWGMNY